MGNHFCESPLRIPSRLGNRTFPLTATLTGRDPSKRSAPTLFVDFSQRTAVYGLGVFGAAVIVKTDLPSLHHLRPLTTEPFVYSHAGGGGRGIYYQCHDTPDRTKKGRRLIIFRGMNACAGGKGGGGRERNDATRDFVRMLFTRWSSSRGGIFFFFLFAMALVIGTRSRVQRSLNFSGKQFSLRRIIDEKWGRTRRGNKSTARKRSTINFNFNSHILVDFSFIVLRIHKQFNECLLSSWMLICQLSSVSVYFVNVFRLLFTSGNFNLLWPVNKFKFIVIHTIRLYFSLFTILKKL